MATAAATVNNGRLDIDFENPDTLKEAEAVLGDLADWWLNNENLYLGLKKPIDLIGTQEEELVRNQLAAIKYGFVT